MTAKEYLQNYELLELELRHLCDELSELRQGLYSVSAVDTEKPRVQEARRENNRFERYDALERKIDELIDSKQALKHQIITDIHKLGKVNYINVLYKRYIELKSLKQISREMHNDYDWVRHLHGYALAEFENKVLKVHTQTHI
jgi:predicted nuclease with TOPRIM domain